MLERSARTSILANRVAGRPDRLIRRTYLLAIRRARSSIDIAGAYFLPGPLFLRALREARKRGVRVRVLVPASSDVWLVDLAMLGGVDKLVLDDIEVHRYERSVLHSKPAVLDGRVVMVGSHNLDAFSWRFDLEANVVVDDRAFAAEFAGSFERDLAVASRLDLATICARPRRTRALAWFVAKFRTLL